MAIVFVLNYCLPVNQYLLPYAISFRIYKASFKKERMKILLNNLNGNQTLNLTNMKVSISAFSAAVLLFAFFVCGKIEFGLKYILNAKIPSKLENQAASSSYSCNDCGTDWDITKASVVSTSGPNDYCRVSRWTLVRSILDFFISFRKP